MRLRLFSSCVSAPPQNAASATRQHRDSQGFVFLETSKGVPQLPQESRIQSVCFFRPVEEDSGHRTFALHIHHAFILQPRGFEKSLDCDPDHRAVQARVAQRVHPGDFSPEQGCATHGRRGLYTLRYIPAREDVDQLGAFEGRGHPQREAIEACPAGGVLVMDARRDASAATGGDILMTRLQVRGVAGVVTDGGLRDSPTIEKLPWPAYCGARSAPLNLVRHHAVESQVPIGCGGVAVYPGDVVVGDAEGVVVIPAKMAEEVAKEAEAQTEFEDWVEARVKEGRSIFGLYPPNAETKAEFEAFRKKR